METFSENVHFLVPFLLLFFLAKHGSLSVWFFFLHIAMLFRGGSQSYAHTILCLLIQSVPDACNFCGSHCSVAVSLTDLHGGAAGDVLQLQAILVL